MASEAITEHLILKNFLREHVIHESDIHITPLLKILAMGQPPDKWPAMSVCHPASHLPLLPRLPKQISILHLRNIHDRIWFCPTSLLFSLVPLFFRLLPTTYFLPRIGQFGAMCKLSTLVTPDLPSSLEAHLPSGLLLTILSSVHTTSTVPSTWTAPS